VNRPGFSLLEMIIVLGLVLVIVRFSMGAFSFFDRVLVRHELERLYMLFIALQRRAILEMREYRLTLDIVGNSYTVGNHKELLARGVMFGTTADVKGPPSNSAQVIVRPATFPHATVVFYPDGKIQAGTIYLTDKNNSCAYALSCPVGEITYIRRYSMLKGSWVCLV
jgi:prepilin-type N-terminal cleavage/methylation domain-containing protein